ncbi:MAG: ABC transporter substrate-binding protein [Defluviitaleaceae bacterium]|nr:ABC transporter substrate-binding protein [Defluviitaleaceae bacterium]
MQKKVVLLLAALFVLFLSACDGYVYAFTPYNSSGADEVHIGVVYPVAMRDMDTFFYRGIELAISRINERGGVLGKPLRTLIRDDENDSHLAMQIANTFSEQGITAVIGHWSTDISTFLADVYEANGVVMMTPAASGTNLFESKYNYIYRMSANHYVFAKVMAEYLYDVGLSRVAVIYSDDEFGINFAAILEQELSRLGIIVVDRSIGITPASVGTIMERWRAFGCDGIIMATSMAHIIEPIKILQSAGNTLPIFGGDSFNRHDLPEILGEYANMVYSLTFALDALDPDFLEAFRTTYGHDPDIRAITGYMAVNLIADAIEAKGTTDSTAIAEFLSQLQNHPTIKGELSYNPETQEFEHLKVVVRRLG